MLEPSQVPAPRQTPEQSLSFHRGVQRSRLTVMLVLGTVAVLASAFGAVQFDPRAASVILLIGLGSAPLLLWLYRWTVRRNLSWNLHPIWIGLDIILISWMIYLVDDTAPLWLIWYLANTSAAAFVLGRRAAEWVMGISAAAYLAVLVALNKIQGLDAELLWALGRLTVLYGGCYFMIRGIAALRQKRLEVQQLLDERSRRLVELEHLASELDRRSRELARANLQADAANRAKSQFLASMSHELRTPLNSILGFAEILQERLAGQLEPRLERFLGHILASGRHLLGLINDILDLSKIEAGKFELQREQINVADVVNGVLSVLEGIARPHRIELECDIEANLPVIVADPPRVKQILYNLVSNAIKFSPDGSKVLVKARSLPLPQQESQLEGVALEVIDQGPGIRAEDVPLIFEEFRQLENPMVRARGGTGLGLALVKRFVDLHGGLIDVQSEPGKGSTFRVCLPLRPGDNKATSTPRKDTTSGPTPESRTRRTVLTVEDDDAFAAALGRDLMAAGYQVVRARSGEEGLELVRQLKPDAITLDLVLPDRDGWDVLRELKRNPETASIPAVIVSMISNEELGFALGATAYFSKPLDREKFLAELLRLLPPEPESGRRILVIDDDPQIHELLGEMLGAVGYQLFSARSVEEGLQLARATQPHGIVLDLIMEGLDGFEAAAQLAADENTAQIPILVFSNKDLSSAEQTQLAGRLRAIMPKSPIDRRRFVEMLGELIDRSQRERVVS